MGSMLDILKDKIIMEFKIGNEDNFEVMKKIDVGFSGAEVYLIELKNYSDKKGYFYLKIDNNSKEFKNSSNTIPFKKAITYLDKREIADKYVMLISVAGNSIYDYQSFFKLELPTQKTEAAKLIFSEIFSEAFNIDTVIGGSVLPISLFKKYCGNKLNRENRIYEFLELKFNDVLPDSVNNIQYDDSVIPNAYAYAINNEIWEGLKLPVLNCFQHGDLHGDNVFVSKGNEGYSIIDFALSREDGYMFFDSAYFVLCLLMRVYKNETAKKFFYDVKELS